MKRASKAAIWIASCFLMARLSVTYGQRGAVNGEWRWYGGDAGGDKYSPLDQINAENVNRLQIVWRWKREGLGSRPNSNWQVTPLMAEARCISPLERSARPSRSMRHQATRFGPICWMKALEEHRRRARTIVVSLIGQTGLTTPEFF